MCALRRERNAEAEQGTGERRRAAARRAGRAAGLPLVAAVVVRRLRACSALLTARRRSSFAASVAAGSRRAWPLDSPPCATRTARAAAPDRPAPATATPTLARRSSLPFPIAGVALDRRGIVVHHNDSRRELFPKVRAASR